MKLMVIDGNSIVNRAFYGIRMLNAPDGTPTNGVYGFLNILQRLLSEEEPEALCVTFDVHAPTFRHLKSAEYKATRKGMPEELQVQMPILKEVLDAMNIPRYELAGYEADDLIGTISEKCAVAGWDCCIVTGDKDSFQLISDKVSVKHVKSRMGKTETKTYDSAAFTEEYGFEPIKMIDLKALMGDASDNIPGVAGIGEKTAMDLVQRFGFVKDIYSGLGELDIKDAVRKKLEAGREQAESSYELAAICRDVPVEFSPEENLRKAPDAGKLYEIFTRLGFQRLIGKFDLKPPEDTAAAETAPGITCTAILDEKGLEEALAEIIKNGAGLWCGAGLMDVGFACGEKGWYISRGRFAGDFEKALGKIFGPDVKKTGHNIKDIQRSLLDIGVEPENWAFDTAIAAYLLDATASSYELERLCPKYCGFEISAGKDEQQMTLLPDGSEEAAFAARAGAVARLAEKLDEKLRELNMEKLMYEIELPLCPVLARMEREGFLVDRKALADFGAMLSQGIDRLQEDIWRETGQEFNINSPKQLGKVLFEDLGLPAPKKTKSGYSTGADVLEKLAVKYPIVQSVLDFRQLSKLKSTYSDGLLKVIGDDGRIHTSFQMTVTATGRLSSTEPNLQNIPIRTELGGEVRKMFVAGEGKVLVDADYSQIELRLLAHISGDETMQEAFRRGEDIHRVTASQVFEVPFEEVTPYMRSHAKAVNFGIVYGISDFSLAQDIGVTRAEAKRYMESYLGKYHGVREYMKDVVEKAREAGYVETLYGRRRYLPELKSSNFNLRSFGERVALNMPVQGTAADIMKIAMVNVARRLREEGLEARLILQVHDELIAECPESEAERTAEILRCEMESAASLSVPLTADAKTGKSWFEAH